MGQFLPINRKEMEERGWQEVDFVYICGDAYVDHPSFGAAIICRTLEANGFKVAFLSQPDWHKVEEFRQFGKPRLGFLISSGNIDSMVNHYTVSKKRRHKDSYTSGGLYIHLTEQCSYYIVCKTVAPANFYFCRVNCDEFTKTKSLRMYFI